LDWPVLLAPVAYQQLAHPEGEIASARGHGHAHRHGGQHPVQLHPGRNRPGRAAAAQELGRSGPLWFQLYQPA
jgi:4-hydroxymandelate oxidase